MRTTTIRRGGAAIVLTAAVVGGLTGCGSSSGTPTAAASTAAPGTGGPNGRIDPALRQKITSCLQAAGIAVPTFTPRPSGESRPTGQPRPSGQPRPTGAPGGGGFGAVFSSPEAKAALQACGITLPTRSARPSPTAAA